MPTGGLVNLQTGQVADWTAYGLGKLHSSQFADVMLLWVL